MVLIKKIITLSIDGVIMVGKRRETYNKMETHGTATITRQSGRLITYLGADAIEYAQSMFKKDDQCVKLVVNKNGEETTYTK